MSERCPGGCGIDFAEFPEMRHSEDECGGPECTCYEIIGGHQPGCYFYRVSISATCNHCTCWPDSVAGSGCRCPQPCRKCQREAETEKPF